MNQPNYYRTILDQNTINDRPWTNKEENMYRCAKLQLANKQANMSFLNALCIGIGIVVIWYCLSNIAIALIKIRIRS